MSFIKLRNIPSIPSLLNVFTMKVCGCFSNDFLYIYKWSLEIILFLQVLFYPYLFSPLPWDSGNMNVTSFYRHTSSWDYLHLFFFYFLFFRLGIFYFYFLKFTDSFLCHLHSPAELTNSVFILVSVFFIYKISNLLNTLFAQTFFLLRLSIFKFVSSQFVIAPESIFIKAALKSLSGHSIFSVIGVSASMDCLLSLSLRSSWFLVGWVMF